MSARAIWEATGKDLINRNLTLDAANKCRFAVFDESTAWSRLIEQEPWLQTEVCRHITREWVQAFLLMSLSRSL